MVIELDFPSPPEDCDCKKVRGSELSVESYPSAAVQRYLPFADGPISTIRAELSSLRERAYSLYDDGASQAGDGPTQLIPKCSLMRF